MVFRGRRCAAFGLARSSISATLALDSSSERLANERKAAERDPEEELALLRDEQLSQIPALDNLLRRSNESQIRKMLEQAGMATRAGNFLVLCSCLAGIGVRDRGLRRSAARRSRMAGAACLGLCFPIRMRPTGEPTFEKFEELFPKPSTPWPVRFVPATPLPQRWK